MQSKHSCCANVGGGTPVFLWLNTKWHFQQDPTVDLELALSFKENVMHNLDGGKIHWFDARSHKWGSKKLKMINICTTK